MFLTVDFQPGQTLRYKFTSKKNIAVDWDPNAAANANHVQEQSETFEMIVAYTPVEVDPYGVSTVRAAVESVQAVRSGGPASRNFGTDAVESRPRQELHAQGRSAGQDRRCLGTVGIDSGDGQAGVSGRTLGADGSRSRT